MRHRVPALAIALSLLASLAMAGTPNTVIDEVFASGTKPISGGTTTTGSTPAPTTQITAYNAANSANHAFNDGWIDTWGGVYSVTSGGNLAAVPTLGTGNAAFLKTFLVRPMSEAVLNQRMTVYYNFDSAQNIGLLLRANTVNSSAIRCIAKGTGAFDGFDLGSNWSNGGTPTSGTFTAPSNGTPMIFTATCQSTFGATSVSPLTPGQNYGATPTVTVNGDGTGMAITPVLGTVNSAGQVNSYTVTTAGTGYTWATATVTPAAGDRGAGATCVVNFGNSSTVLSLSIATQATPGTPLGTATRTTTTAAVQPAGAFGFDNQFWNLTSAAVTEIKCENLDNVTTLQVGQPTLTGDSAGNNLGLTWAGGSVPVKATLYEYTTQAAPPNTLASYTSVGSVTASGATIRRSPPSAGQRYQYRWQLSDGTGNNWTSPVGNAPTAGIGDAIYSFQAPLFNAPLEVFFIGDSITIGESTAPALSTQARVCVDYLSMRLSPCSVYGFDYGVSGSRTDQWVSGQANYNTVKSAIIAAAPSFPTGAKLVIPVMLGTNDAQGAIAPSTTTANLNAMMASLTSDLAGAGVTQVPTFVVSHIPYNYILNYYAATIATNGAIDAVTYGPNVIRGATSAQVFEMTAAHPEGYHSDMLAYQPSPSVNDGVHVGGIVDARTFSGRRALGMAWGQGVYDALNPAASAAQRPRRPFYFVAPPAAPVRLPAILHPKKRKAA